ncbi:MAG TPA: ankyrin repeat domain-containing protein, partial [Sumerlaeia bacterium]|nr:ankyrin repeat domain-containing protein [Sumerlaeia bacterium]
MSRIGQRRFLAILSVLLTALLTRAAADPLREAAAAGDLTKVKALVEEGADVKGADEAGLTPLHAAARDGHDAVVNHLIAKGADANATDSQGRTPLHLAAERGHLQTTVMLLARRSNANARDREGRTPLHCAASQGRKDVAEILLALGADPNVKDDRDGATPLHLAANRDVADALIAKGADATIRDKNGRTARYAPVSADAGQATPTPTTKGDSSAQRLATKTDQEIAKETFPSVVVVVTADGSLGSGFFVRPGVIATNLHVVERASRGFTRVVGEKKESAIRGLLAVDREQDLILLAVEETHAPPLRLASNDGVSIGEEVFAVGNPIGLEGTFSKGVASGIRETDGGTRLQITAPISKGSSGGPVLNRRGEVIGVAVATILEGQNLNFAVPVSALRKLIARKGPLRGLSTAGKSEQPEIAASRQEPEKREPFVERGVLELRIGKPEIME